MYVEIYTILVSKLIRFIIKRLNKLYKVNDLTIYKFKDVFPPKNMLSNDVLITIASVMKKIITEEGLRFNILEIGVGSGVISLSLANIYTYVIGIDTSFQACLNTLYNDHERKLDIICGDLTESIRKHSIEIVYMNPPYLPCNVEDAADISICGGREKSNMYRMIISPIRVLSSNGIFVLSVSSISPLLNIMIEGISKLFSKVIIYSRRFIPFESINVYILIRNQ